LLFSLVGAPLPLSERLFPLRYPQQEPGEVVRSLAQEGILEAAGQDGDDLFAFLEQPGARLAWGQVLYPRFYEQGQGEPDIYSFLRIQSYPRLTFTIGNRTGGPVVLPLQESPAVLPDGSAVYAFGCSGSDSLDALVVLLLSPGGQLQVLERWPRSGWTCPLPAPVCDNNRNCY
jgi:hypothetical protein